MKTVILTKEEARLSYATAHGKLEVYAAFVSHTDDGMIEVEANESGEPLFTSYAGRRHTKAELDEQFRQYGGGV